MVLKEMMDQIVLQCDKDAICVRETDRSCAILVDLRLEKIGFVCFQVEQKTNLGIDLKSIIEILELSKKSDNIKISADNEYITFNIDPLNHSISTNASLKLKEIEQKNYNITSTDYKCEVELLSSDFLEICTKLEMFGNYVKIDVYNKYVKFSLYGPDCKIDNYNIIIKEGKTTHLDIKEECSLNVGSKYLKKITNAAKLSEKIKLYINPNSPLKVEYALDVGFASLCYYLAPRDDKDEDD